VKDWKFGEVKGIHPIDGNTLEGEHLKGCIRKVDMVFHLACIPFIPDGYVNPRKVVETDIIGTLNVLLAVKENKTQLVHYSSSETYGGSMYRGRWVCRSCKNIELDRVNYDYIGADYGV
jgi:nucleoside-diphosphate-sugar epimerase